MGLCDSCEQKNCCGYASEDVIRCGDFLAPPTKCEKCLYYPHCDEYHFDESGCDDFKDASLFVEMPCKIGDTVWFTTYGDIPTCTEVYRISCNIGADGLHSYFETQDTNGNTDYFHGEAFGKSVFLSKDAAEAVLAERMACQFED